jgi:hypothetical protein
MRIPQFARAISTRVIRRFILWALRRAGAGYSVVTFGGSHLFRRFEFLWPDEYGGTNRLPWWRPFNALLHCWAPAVNQREAMHDHPRWSISVCLRGRIIERTPWNERLLTPGSIVFRSRKAIHSFEVPAGFRGKTWTLFIVGPRKYRQNTYQVVAR